MVLDLVANTKWDRPIYFAVTTGDEAYVGLKKYFQLETNLLAFISVERVDTKTKYHFCGT